jgi:diguanylate cyclase (GGDEF)-like protein
MKHGRIRFEASDLPPSPFGPRGLLSVDTSGNVIAPYGDGLAIQQDGRWKVIGRAAGIHGPIYSVLQDREGSVWLGLGGHGLVRWLGYRQWEHYNAEDGLDGELVYEVNNPADGTLWAGTDSGLFRARKTGTKWKWRKERTLGDIPIHSVRPDAEGHLWLGTESHGAARMETRTGQVEWFDKRRGLTADSPYTMLPDHSNRIWAGSLTGLFVADRNTLRFQAVPEVPAVLCLAIVEAPDGTIWAGTKQGLFQLSGDHWREFTTKDGLSHNEVLSLAAAENGDIWVGYQFGSEIDRIQPHESGFEISHEGRDLLSAQGVTYFLGFDAGKRLWVGTNRGVYLRDRGSWQHYDQHDGLVWDDCDLNGFAAMPDGAVWIGTSGGLAHFLPGAENPRQDPPRAIFTKLTLGGNDAAENASVGHRANALAVRFSALSFVHENRLLFRYRLAPLFSDWRETRQRDLQFPGLAPDSYRLEVEARDGSGLWSAEPALFAFEVQPPLWRTWWAMSLLVAAALGLLAMAVRWRGEAARQRENDLVRLVDERTTKLNDANGSLLETTLKLQDVNKYLVRLSNIDGLTDIANRRMFEKTLAEEWEHSKIEGTPLSVILADIDYFKRLNDAAGHQAGDECLKRIAAELAKAVKRDSDLVARFGGEEFVLILPRTGHYEATLFAETIRASVERLDIRHPDSPISSKVTISLGIATEIGDRFASFDALVGGADAALYAAKQRGRNRAASFELIYEGAYAGSDESARMTRV